MIALGFTLDAMLHGGGTVVSGLACTPTAPASLTVNVGAGSIVTSSYVDLTDFGSLTADSTDALVKMGINLTSTPFPLTAPTTSGQSINYLIQAAFQESDTNPLVLPYYNSANPAQPYSGPSNTGVAQNTQRVQRVQLQLKAGGSANTGTQGTPPVDAGWIGLYTITVNYGQTQVTAGNIAAYPNAPFLASHLASHHGGVPGQAPKINLATEVQGTLTWDAVPSGGSHVYPNPGTFTFVAPVTADYLVDLVGGGGGSGGCSGAGGQGGGCGGAGGYASKRVRLIALQQVTVTVGAGGAGGAAGWGSASNSGQNGGSTSFGSYHSATGGGGGLASTTPSGGAGGAGSGGDVNALGGYGSDGAVQETSGVEVGSGLGGASFFGGGSRSGTGGGTSGSAPGSGAGAPYGPAALTGYTGAAGLVVIKW